MICPWHGYEYNPCTGKPPEGFPDAATGYAIEQRDDGLYVELPVPEERVSLMDQMVDVLTDWGIDTVFGMVGHSNLGLADALRKAEEAGRLRFIGIRHEGAAAFAASGYGKLTGRPAACFSIAGPGATNLLTGLWDAKVDRRADPRADRPGADAGGRPGRVPGAAARRGVRRGQRVEPDGALAQERDRARGARGQARRREPRRRPPDLPRRGAGARGRRRARPRARAPAASPTTEIAPPEAELARAIAMLEAAERPVIIVGNGARPFRDAVLALAERIDAPVITTFKAKGLVPDDHPLACGVLGPVGHPGRLGA